MTTKKAHQNVTKSHSSFHIYLCGRCAPFQVRTHSPNNCPRNINFYIFFIIYYSIASVAVGFVFSLSLFSPFNFLSRSHSLLCCSEHSVCVCVYFLLCSLMPVRIYFRVMGVVLAIKYEKRAIPFALGVVSSCLSWTLRKNVDIFLYTIFFSSARH